MNAIQIFKKFYSILVVDLGIKLFFLFLIYSLAFVSLFSKDNALDYYKNHFDTPPKHPLADTLFEKTVWRRKVSHLVVEGRQNKYRLTLLMISPYPYAYKSPNYHIYYEFATYEKALRKFKEMDFLLQKDGVLRVTLLGSKIVKEKILYQR